MTKEIIIVLLLLALICLYYQNRKLVQSPSSDFEWEEPRPRKTALIFDHDEEEKAELIAEHKQQLREWETKEQNYLQQIKELKESREHSPDDLEDNEELTAELDELKRDKGEEWFNYHFN